MKKLTFLLTALLIIALSCNKIDTSQEVFNIIGPVEVSPWDPAYAATVVQKIYMEEFTGHFCTFCPTAARDLKILMDEDPTIVATAIHCTTLANPGNEPFANNYKTQMGDVICEDFTINGLPKATINRKKKPDNEWGFGRTEWRSALDAIDRNNVRAGIELECVVNETKKEIEAKVAVTIIKELPNPVQICLILQEDSIISGQVDGGNYLSNYVHMHMLRAGFNRDYGTKLTTNGMVSAQTKYSTSFKLSYANPFPFSNFLTEIKNCSVVAYLIDLETKEVLQVEYVHLQ
jgi:hypothetical protein